MIQINATSTCEHQVGLLTLQNSQQVQPYLDSAICNVSQECCSMDEGILRELQHTANQGLSQFLLWAQHMRHARDTRVSHVSNRTTCKSASSKARSTAHLNRHGIDESSLRLGGVRPCLRLCGDLQQRRPQLLVLCGGSGFNRAMFRHPVQLAENKGHKCTLATLWRHA